MIPRLTDIIAAGFCCEQHIDWARFLFQGLYDPRLFIFIFDFAFDFKLFGEKRLYDPRLFLVIFAFALFMGEPRKRGR